MNIKMSDVFENTVTVKQVDADSCDLIDGQISHPNTIHFANCDAHLAEYIAHAINNHDRLVEENEKLKEKLIVAYKHLNICVEKIERVEDCVGNILVGMPECDFDFMKTLK